VTDLLGSIAVQILNGLTGTTSLFLVGAGLSLIFGVTRIVNFAHGSFYMLGIYCAYSLIEFFSQQQVNSIIGFWGGIIFAAVIVAVIGALIEMTLLRRIYRAPELFQLLGTFALTLIIKDVALAYWGPEDLLGPKAPGLKGAVEFFGRSVPEYDLLTIVFGPLVLGALWLLLTKTRWGLLIRAATQDREIVGALGVNQKWLFTSVFALGAFLAALGGALQIPREPANLSLDLAVIGDAFVVVVVGGMGSIPGAFVAALVISMVKALCIGLGTVQIGEHSFAFSKLTMVAEFLVMAAVLVWRPWGLFGKPQAAARNVGEIEAPLRNLSSASKIALVVSAIALLLLPLLAEHYPYSVIIAIDILIAILFAQSLHFVMGPGGMHSFGHAAYFGLGAYGTALFFKALALPMEVALLLAPLLAGLGALIFGWFCVRLSGVYLAMLTLAFAQIVWSVVFQWDGITGGSNGLLGLWPSEWLQNKVAFYYLSLGLVATAVWLLFKLLNAPFGYALRATRDSPLRAAAIGINQDRIQWAAFVVAGLSAGLAGALFAFAKGTISPETLSVAKSVDGLVMVLLGGIQSLAGPVVGASLFTWLQDLLMRETDYWRAGLGAVVLTLVMLFPGGVVGGLSALWNRVFLNGRAANVK
jgi:branched-chain amino acid transport system permease protein